MRLVLPALVAALGAASWLHAAEPRVTLDERVETDGLLQLGCVASPAGYHRPTQAFAAVPLRPCGPRDVPPPVAPYETRAQVVMRLGPAPELDAKSVPTAIAAGLGAPDEVTRWLEALRALSRFPATAGALAQERRELAPALAKFQERLSSGAFVAGMEEYTGLPLPGTHRVFLSPFHSAGGVANVVASAADGTVEVSSLLGPARVGSVEEYWTARVPGTLWHEEAHAVLDPLADAWAERIERARPVDSSAICYGEWRQCVREHVVRAVMIRLLARRPGPDAAADQLAFENPARFRWLVPMIERLKAYEADRARWPTLADFYPLLLDAVREEAVEDGAPLHHGQEPAVDRARLILLARSALPRMRDARARRQLVRALELAKHPDTLVLAPAVSTTAVVTSADTSGALAARGVTAFQSGRSAEALSLLDQALSRDPDDAEAELSRGVVLEALGRTREARDAYRDAAASARRRKDFPPQVLADAEESYARLLKAR